MARIKNKYLRNRIYKQKTWKRVKRIRGGEGRFKLYCLPLFYFLSEDDRLIKWATKNYDIQTQLNDRFDFNEVWVRWLTKGCSPSTFHAPAHCRRGLNKKRRSNEKAALRKIAAGLEVEIPTFKQDMDWDWF